MKNYTCEHIRWVVHGTRRKRCVQCGKTRTVRARRRGRKRKRVGTVALIRYLTGHTVKTPLRDLCRARDLFIRTTPWPTVTDLSGPLILIADALHIKTRTYRIAVHIVLITSAHSEYAWILPVHFDTRHEGALSWKAAFETALTPHLKARVHVLVCDGKPALIQYARMHAWEVQRCQFHFIARLQALRSVRSLSRHRKEGVFLHTLTQTMFTTSSVSVCAHTAQQIARIAHTEPNRHLKTVLSGFVKHYRDYRTHLEHPELCIPHTTNAVESLNSLIRGLMWKMRGFENEVSARLWITALLKHKRYMRLKNHRKSV